MAYADSFKIICFSQWVAYVDSIGIICYSQPVGGLHRFYWRCLLFAMASGWLTSILLALFVIASRWVVYADPLTLCVLASGWLAQFHLVSFSLICSGSGWYTQFLLLFLLFPFSTALFGQRLA